MSKTRLDWDENHKLITETYMKLSKKKSKRPSLAEVSKVTGFSIRTIHLHLKELAEMSFEERFRDLKLMSDSLLISMHKYGATGRASCAKLFFQMVDGFTEKTDHKIKFDELSLMSKKELEAKLNEYTIPKREKKKKPKTKKKAVKNAKKSK